MAGLQAEIYTIICVITGENTVFPVKIASDETVGFLKKMIKAENPNRFANVDAYDLTLYRVDISGSEEERKKELEEMAEDLGERVHLDPLDKLTKIYPIAPARKTTHIIVQPPERGPRGLKHMASSEANKGVAVKQRRLYKDFTSNVAPSAFGGQETYKRLEQTKFALNRPPVSETIPLAISHPIFGEFVQNAETYTPTATDNALVLELQNMMSKTYDTELEYCSEFHRVLRQHYTEVELEPALVGSTKYVSDGHLSVGGFMSSVCEGKLWKGSGDPEVQAAGYFIVSVRQSVKRVGDYPDKFPCMIIYIFGSFICFAGAVVTDRLHLEVLTPALPMHINFHEDKIATRAAHILGAFRDAIGKLQVHYTSLRKLIVAHKKGEPWVDGEYEGLVYPYRCHYFDKNGAKIEFRYVQRLFEHKLLFLCEITADNVTPRPNLCVKFTRRYSKEAHHHCADQGVAPKLYNVETLPGDWIMVVMQMLDDSIYEPLLAPESTQALFAPEVRRVVGVLHQGNFVHGDVRGVNLMVRRQSGTTDKGGNVLLVDFDWAGRQGPKTRCPPNVNREIFRPPGAIDGDIITREHDLTMVDNMFN